MLLLGTQEFGRPYLVAQGVPDAVVSVLRTAFDQTMQSMDFRADAGRRALDLDPTTGAEIQTLVENIYKTRPEVVTRVRKILENSPMRSIGWLPTNN